MKILLASDGSENADAAVDFLARFPLPEECTVTLLTVVDPHLYAGGEAAGLSDEDRALLEKTGNTISGEAQQCLDGQAERLKREGWTVSTLVRSGNVAREILSAVEELAVELLVVGSHGMSAFRRFLLGSVSTRMLEHAPCSVLIIRDGADENFVPVPTLAENWRVLLAYDDSGLAKNALSLCASLPFGARDEIHVVTVISIVTAYRQDIVQQMNPIWKQKKHQAAEALESAAVSLRKAVPNVDTELREGTSSANEIIEAAAGSECNLVMLGSRGRNAVERFLVGSITSQVARHAHCSVWVVRV